MQRRKLLAVMGAAAVAGCGGGDSTDTAAPDETTATDETTAPDETTVAETDSATPAETDSPTEEATDSPTESSTAGATTPPRYVDWLPTEVPAGPIQPAEGISITFETFRLLADDSTPTGTPTPTPTRTTIPGRGEDPLLALVLENVIAVSFGVGFAAQPNGLEPITEPGAPTDRLTVVANSIVFEGSYDPSSLSSGVTEAGSTEFETYGGYTLYGASSSADRSDESVVALSDNAAIVVIQSDTVEDTVGRARRLIDTGAGNAARYRDATPGFDTMVGRLPRDDLTSATYTGGRLFSTPTPDADGDTDVTAVRQLPLEGDAVGVATSSSLSEEEILARAAFRYSSPDEVDDRSTLEQTLGFGAASRDITVDGQSVVVTATYPGG